MSREQTAHELATVVSRRMRCERDLVDATPGERLGLAEHYVRLVREEVKLFTAIGEGVDD